MIKLKKLLLEDETGLGSKVTSASSSVKGFTKNMGMTVKNYRPRQSLFKSFGELKSKYDKLGAIFMYWFVEAFNVALTVNLANKINVQDPGGDSNEQELKKVFADAVEVIKKNIKTIIDRHVSDEMVRQGEDYYEGSKSKKAKTTIQSIRGQEIYLKIKKINYLPQLETLLKQLIYDGNESVYAFIVNESKNAQQNKQSQGSGNVMRYPITENNIYNVIYTVLQPHILEAMKTLKNTPEWKDFTQGNGDIDDTDNKGKSKYFLDNYDGKSLFEGGLITLKKNNGVAGFTYYYAMLHALKTTFEVNLSKKINSNQNGITNYDEKTYNNMFASINKEILNYTTNNLNKNLNEIYKQNNSSLNSQIQNITKQNMLENFIKNTIYDGSNSIYNIGLADLKDTKTSNINVGYGIENLIYLNIKNPIKDVINNMKKDQMWSQTPLQNIKFP